MAKLFAAVCVVFLVAACSAEVTRSSRRLRNRSRFLARQEIAKDVQPTPYPPAGNKPDVEFGLPGDQTEDFGEQAVAPDQKYGPPESEAEPLEPQEDFAANSELQRLTAFRGSNRNDLQGRRVAALKNAAPLRAAAKLQTIQSSQAQILAQPELPLRNGAQLQVLQPQLFAQPAPLSPAQVQVLQSQQPQFFAAQPAQLRTAGQLQVLQPQQPQTLVQPAPLTVSQLQALQSQQQQFLAQPAQLQSLQPQQQQLLAQPIILADGRIIYSVFP